MADAIAKREQTAAEKLNNEYSVKFLKKELIIMNNFLIAQKYSVVDALAVYAILNKIRPFIEDTMEQPPVTTSEETNHVTTSTKE